jgi:hypothetical protein
MVTGRRRNPQLSARHNSNARTLTVARVTLFLGEIHAAQSNPSSRWSQLATRAAIRTLSYKAAINDHYKAFPVCIWSQAKKFPVQAATSDDAKTMHRTGPPNLLLEYFFDLPDLLFNFAGGMFGSAVSL